MVFTLYSRTGCHLCEEILEALKPWQKQFNFDIDIIDIDSSKDLTERYAARIPVLCHDNTEICQYYLDETALSHFFKHNKPEY